MAVPMQFSVAEQWCEGDSRQLYDLSKCTAHESYYSCTRLSNLRFQMSNWDDDREGRAAVAAVDSRLQYNFPYGWAKQSRTYAWLCHRNAFCNDAVCVTV
jgi:hypothetical protein